MLTSLDQPQVKEDQPQIEDKKDESVELVEEKLEPQELIRDKNAQYVERVKSHALKLRGGFGSGKEYKTDLFYRKLISDLFSQELGGIDLSDSNATVDSVFTTVVNELSSRKEEIGEEMKREIIARLGAIAMVATRRVTFANHVLAMDMAKAYVNYRPTAKLVNKTFYEALLDYANS